jgi:ferric-dicitrate binding protein FerR (iron transport regulator)
MSREERQQASLERLIREARDQQPSEPDWSRVEAALMAQARREKPKAPSAPRGVMWGALALAAAVALWVGLRAPQSAETPVPQANAARTPAAVRDGDALELGSRIEAVRSAITVSHPGHAVWKLLAGSSAFLAERGERVVVHLEHGSIIARVVPNPKPETFVVETDTARVAVHGTVFRVTLRGGRLLVKLHEGSVAVGPKDGSPVFMLKAPASGDFALDGRTGEVSGSVPSEPSESDARDDLPKSVPARVVPRPTLPSAAPPAPSVELPDELSIGDIEDGVSRVVDATSTCFRQFNQPKPGLEITVRTALTLKVQPDGSVADVDFQPPLAPDVERCATASVSQIRFASSKQGSSVTRMLELKP